MPTAEQEGERVGECEANCGTHSCSHSEMDMKLPLLSQIDRVGKLCCVLPDSVRYATLTWYCDIILIAMWINWL